jgi:hypothetical protein
MKNTIITAVSILIGMATASAQSNLLATTLSKTQNSLFDRDVIAANADLAREHKQAFMAWAIMYRNVTDVDGLALKDKNVVFAWKENGARYRAFFTDKGIWLHTVVSYEEELLPEQVKQLIRSTYTKLPISYVDEVRAPDLNTVYRVQLQDEKKLVILKVAGDEMEKEAEYRR